MEKPKFSTYLSIARDLIDENPKFYSKPEQKGLISFAKYLDKGNAFGGDLHLQVLAYQKAQEIDKEVLQECIAEFGREPMTDVVKRVYARHKH